MIKMNHQFNLITQPWIPVVTLGGETQVVSLREALFNAPNLRSISTSLPHSNAAVLRLLLAILHRTFGPPDPDAWKALWDDGTFNSPLLDGYLNKWQDRFDLFDPIHPFMQQRHPKVNEKPVQELLQLIGGGDTYSLFDHVMDDTPFRMASAEAALMLITIQAFGLAGLCHPQLKLNYTDASCSRAVIFFIEGKTLFETLMFNLIQYNPPKPSPLLNVEADRPAWEVDDPYVPGRTHPLGHLDFLTWPNRRIMLIPEDIEGQTFVSRITTAPGLVLSPEVRNPMVLYRIDTGKKAGEETVRIFRFNEGRSLWRDSHALLDLDNQQAEVPRSLIWVRDLMINGIVPHRRLQLAAYGMCTEPGKQKVHFYRGERFEFDDRILNDRTLVSHLNTALIHAEAIRRELWNVMTQLATMFLSFSVDRENGRKPDAKDVQNLVNHWNAEGLYWSRLELPFYTFLNRLPDEPEAALKAWDAELIDAFRSAYRQTANGLGESLEAMKAVAKTQGLVNRAINRVLVNPVQEG